jgi:glycosyltransferase involved in cell wall biosynthesis
VAGETRLTIVQYAGDFLEAALRLAVNGAETYRAQRYTVDFVQSLVPCLESVVTVTAFTDSRYDEVLPSGARAIGAGYTNRMQSKDLVSLVASTEPDLLILRSPLYPLMHWAVSNHRRTLMLLADSFNDGGIKAALKRRALTHYLNKSSVTWVANHGLSAARQLADIGVGRDKVIPWDYPAFNTPDDHEPKSETRTPLRLIYVGMLVESKGVLDLLDAVRLLKQRDIDVRLDLVGREKRVGMAQIAIRDRALSDRVRLVGLLPNDAIIAAMRQADVVVVPSRLEYSEGMPLTIYEALCSRSPLIASNHPMFARCLQHEKNALLFGAGSAVDMAEQIARLADDDALYHRLSMNGLEAWQKIQLPVLWGDLISRWIRDDADDREWLAAHSLASSIYADGP